NPGLGVFKSASEICSIPLAPTQNALTPISTGHPTNVPPPAVVLHSTNIAGAADAAALRTEIQKFWSYNTLTGDNVAEAPYNSLYPRLTTQSNTYAVYVRAQTLQVPKSAVDGIFTSIPERVTGEYRGSYEVERYLDLNDASM